MKQISVPIFLEFCSSVMEKNRLLLLPYEDVVVPDDFLVTKCPNFFSVAKQKGIKTSSIR
ncbi:hypothetical protein QR98_0090660 [Sarcoptes scabiei]|uniref:Uncharacterized protein n=1 Tax=Sarcoptes scabiei TaxID=52283 RepID=A0A132AJ80_SARSC|nr:hypothetical protein QR98_0090660 [Sarcoptes scabiei]